MNHLERFCCDMLHEYLENCNYAMFGTYMNENASVVGTGAAEFFPSKAEFMQSMQVEEEGRSGAIRFLIEKEQYWSQPLSGDISLVLVRLLLREVAGPEKIFCQMEFRLSIILKEAEHLSVLHVHQSSPDPRQKEGEFFPEGMIGSINQQLEKVIARQTGELKRLNKALQYDSEHDYLTGLYNRAYLEEQIEKKLCTSPEAGDVFVMIDVDDFKRYNDQFGHQVGDQILQSIGAWLQREFFNGVAARFAGDEFAVYDQRVDEEKARLRVQEAFTAFRTEPITQQYDVTLSAGIVFREAGQSFESLYQCADKALYHAKRAGKNAFRFYRKGMEANTSLGDLF